jgi:tetratricopeptide (TPR) repeat protein
VLLLAVTFAVRAETNEPASEAPVALTDSSASNDTLRAYLQLQEQLHATQLAIERTRHDAEEANAKNAETMTAQLKAVEQSLSVQRTREAHFLVYVLSAFAGLSFLAVVVTAYFQWRTVNRLADFTTALPMMRPQAGSVSLNENALLAPGTVEQSNSRLLGAIDRLEKRIHELEHAAAPALHDGSARETKVSDGLNGRATVPTIVPQVVDVAEPDNGHETMSLLEEGQALLNQDKPEAAIECFDRVLAVDSRNAEALVKKGAALEKLRKLQEAVECYDRAIAADSSMTIAYLYKGGLYNRLERFGEAVECYEKALQTQEKRSAA